MYEGEHPYRRTKPLQRRHHDRSPAFSLDSRFGDDPTRSLLPSDPAVTLAPSWSAQIPQPSCVQTTQTPLVAFTRCRNILRLPVRHECVCHVRQLRSGRRPGVTEIPRITSSRPWASQFSPTARTLPLSSPSGRAARLYHCRTGAHRSLPHSRESGGRGDGRRPGGRRLCLATHPSVSLDEADARFRHLAALHRALGING